MEYSIRFPRRLEFKKISRFLTTLSPMILEESRNLFNKSSCSHKLCDPNLLCRKCATYPVPPTCSIRCPVFSPRVSMFCPRVPVFQLFVLSAHRVLVCPMVPCSRVPVFPCSCVPVFPCSHVTVFLCSRVPVFLCSRAPCPLSCPVFSCAVSTYPVSRIPSPESWALCPCAPCTVPSVSVPGMSYQCALSTYLRATSHVFVSRALRSQRNPSYLD